MKHYIACLDIPGNTIIVDVYKPQGRPAYVSATEGRLSYRDNGSIECFSTELFGKDRNHRVPLKGNNTAKNAAAATAVMLAELVALGWIAQDSWVS